MIFSLTRLILLSCLFPVLPPDTTVSESILTEWPENGPPILFELNALGNGYSSPTVTEDRFFITGEKDGKGYLYCYDLEAGLIWEKSYGNEWVTSYSGSRAAPTLVDGLLYVCSGTGEITCFKADSGSKEWSLNLLSDLEGENASYGYSMPLIVDDDFLYCSPGGQKNNIAGLNRFTGEIIWSSKGLGETPGYGSPLIINLPKRKIIVTSSEYAILGLDATNGDLLWNYELEFKGELPCNTPLYDGEYLYWVAGPVNGAVMASLTNDGGMKDIIWKNTEFDTFFGDFVKAGDYLYGSSKRHGKWVSVNVRTGKIKDLLRFYMGATILVDDMLIVYNQKGRMGLIHMNQEKMTLASQFRISKGTGEHFSHPVVSNGILFIRHGDTLLAYDISVD